MVLLKNLDKWDSLAERSEFELPVPIRETSGRQLSETVSELIDELSPHETIDCSPAV